MPKKDKWRHNEREGISAGICFELLEPRLLLSGSWGAVADGPAPDSQATPLSDFSQVTVVSSGSTGQPDMEYPLSGEPLVDLLATAPALDTFSAGEASGMVEVLLDVLDTSDQTAHELVLVNANVADYEQLIADLQANDDNRDMEVVVLEADCDGIEQVSAILADRSDLSAVHFITHGADGQINLGDGWLDSETLQQKSTAVSRWGDALTETGDFLFYGCNIAADSAGQSLLSHIADLTGADVAASDDLTGNGSWGGDWVLEAQSGEIETEVAFSSEAQPQWAGVLDSFTVDTNADTADANPGDGLAQDGAGNTSLRAAIEEANALAGADLITLNAGTYTLTGGDLVITDDVSIRGADPNTTAVDGNAADRVFTIESNSTAFLTGITIMNGDQNNSGGVFVDNGSTLNLSDAIVRDNTSNMGGGVHVHGTANLNRVLLMNNSASEGGAIHFHGADGGSLTNVTISGNTATTEGGGLWTDSSITITNVTVANNSATNQGGGLYVGGGTVDIANSIVADNSAGGTGPDVSGTLASSGSNLFESLAGISGLHVSDVTAVDPLLALSDNGGNLWTHAPTAVEAIGMADSSLAPNTDQRAFLRGDGSPDIGAFEVGASAASTADYLDQFNTNASYAGDDGSLSWSNDWQEVNEADNAAGGNARVWDGFSGDGGGNVELFLKNSKGVWREADLSGAAAATLSFDYARVDFEAIDHLVVYIQTAGGTGGVAVGDAPGTWDEIGRYSGVADDAAYLPASMDISGYIAGDTRILFFLDSAVPTDDEIFIDNVRIELSSTPPNAEQVLAVNAGTTVDEGSAGNPVTAAMLATTDADNTADELVYTVTVAPANGTLYLSGVALAATDTFTQDDIDNGRITYDHGGSETVADSFTFSVNDGAGSDSTGTFAITVTPANDAPTATNLISTSAYNEGDPSVATTGIVVSDVDAGEIVTATLTLANTSTGSLSANDGATYTAGTGVWTITDTVANVNLALANLVFTPNLNNDIDTTISVVIDDGDEDAGGPLTGTITLDVTPVDDAPTVVTNEPLSVPEEATRTITTAHLETTDIDTSPDQIVYTLTGLPSDGTVRLSGSALGLGATFTQEDINNNLVTYRDSDDGETTSFTLTVSDGNTALPAFSFSVNGQPINDAPVVQAPGSALNASEQISRSIHGTGFSVSDSDEADAGALATLTVGEGILSVAAGDSGVSIDSGNGTGTVTFSGTIAELDALLTGASTGTITYLNDSDNPSPSTLLTLTVNDQGNTGSDPGLTGDGSSEEDSNSVVITIALVNDAPTAVADTFTVNEGASVNLDLAGNDSDIDDGLDLNSITIVSGPGNGTIDSINADGTVDYTHDGSENFTDSFTYTIDDLATATSNTVTVSLTITPVNDNSPVADDESFTVVEGGTATEADLGAGASLLDGDTDIDLPNDTLTVNTTPVAGPSFGSLTLNADGTFSYTHDGSENFSDSFIYEVSDGAGNSTTATVTITITPVNDPPGVTLNNTLSAIGSDADTSVAIKVADIVISDDAAGSNNLALVGTDAAMFEIVGGNELHLRAGVILDTTTNPNLDVTVTVDDTGVGGTPDAMAVLSITVAAPSSPASPTIPIPPDTGDTTDPPPDPENEVSEPPAEPEESLGEDVTETAVPPMDPVTEENLPIHDAAKSRLALRGDAGPRSTSFRMAAVTFEDIVARVSAMARTEQPADVADPGPQRAEQQTHIHNLMSAQTYLNMVQTLNEVKGEMVGDIAFNQTVLGSAIIMSTGLSVGYVVWLVRGGMLLSSLLSSLPAWQILDPLPILAGKKDGEESDDDESLESILDRKPNPSDPNVAPEDGSQDVQQQGDSL